MVNVTFLGTGNAFSAGKRTNMCLLMEAPEFRMLVETGPMVLEQLSRVGLRAIDVERLFVTHAHGDHVLGFPMLALNRLGASTPLHIYAGLNTIASLRILSTLAFSSLSTDQLNLRWHEISQEGPDEVEPSPGVKIRTILPDYPPGVPTLATRWEFDDGPSVTFITDTRPGQASVELARDSDLLIHEASFSAILEPDADPYAHYHSTAQQAGEIAREAGCRRLALVHLGAKGGDQPEILMEEARAGSDLQVVVPDDGDQIRVTN